MSGIRPDTIAQAAKNTFVWRGIELAVLRDSMRNLITSFILFSSTHALADTTSETTQEVVGGTSVPAGEYRDVVLVVGDNATCTGTLVAPDIVLTAAHCIDINPIEVRTDTVDYSKPGGDRIAVKSARAYPSWEDKYDVGVIMLEHVARGAPRAVASTCHTRKALVEGGYLRVVGFGVTRADGNDSNTLLRQAMLQVIDPDCMTDESCQSAIAPHGEFMAGGNGTDSCFGDSGGPIYLDTPDGPALVGVVSRGLALPGDPCGNGGVYVRADKVVSWIQSVTGAKLERSECDGPADGEDAEDETGGCSAGGSAGWLVALAGIGLVRRRRQTSRSPWGSESLPAG